MIDFRIITPEESERQNKMLGEQLEKILREESRQWNERRNH